jgi:radical SAM superfamily enzyme YgiQ (UPF0313 family)
VDRTVLVRPNGINSYQTAIQPFRACEPPLYLLLMANYYHTDIIVDAEADNLTPVQTVEKIMSYNPKKVVILTTGNHPSAFIQSKDEMLKLSILLEGKTNVETYDYLPIDPCKWSPPRWGLLDMNKYKAHNWHSWSNFGDRKPYGAIFTSISCPMKCEFCTVKSFYGETYQARLIEDVIYDFDTLANLGIKNIKIMDELFIFNPKRVIAICDELINRHYDFNIWAYARIDIMDGQLLETMRKAGIKWLAYGIETGNEDIRKNVLKGNFTNQRVKDVVRMTKDAGINVLGNYMFGFWEDNLETMQQTFDLATELQCEYSNFYCVVAYPGSPLYGKMLSKHVDLPTDFTQYGQLNEEFKPLPTEFLTGKEVLQFRDDAFLKYYSNEDYQHMMLIKFGTKVANDIKDMVNIKLSRI